MPRCGTMTDENIPPLAKGAARKRQPPEGFAFLPPLLRGIFKGVFMPPRRRHDR